MLFWCYRTFFRVIRFVFAVSLWPWQQKGHIWRYRLQWGIQEWQFMDLVAICLTLTTNEGHKSAFSKGSLLEQPYCSIQWLLYWYHQWYWSSISFVMAKWLLAKQLNVRLFRVYDTYLSAASSWYHHICMLCEKRAPTKIILPLLWRKKQNKSFSSVFSPFCFWARLQFCWNVFSETISPFLLNFAPNCA